MLILRVLSSILLLLLLNTCAIRDNQYDPASPFYKAPLLSVAFNFDSTKVALSANSIKATAPFIVSIDAKAYDFFDADETWPVSFQHYLDNIKISEDYAFSGKTDTLITAGNHMYKFSTFADNGANDEEEVTISVTLPRQPIIKTLKCNRDTLPLDTVSIFIYAEIVDSDLVAHHISYSYMPNSWFSDDVPTKELTHEYQHFIDSIPTVLESKREYLHQIIATLYDDLGRSDICTTFIFWSSVIGKPPTIDSIYLHEELPVIYEGQSIQFGVEASDSDGTITSFYWDFGDKDASYEKHPYHTFIKAGTYTVKLTITDNSKNTITDSMLIDVKMKQNLKPYFTREIDVENDSGPAPLDIIVSANVADDDGSIQSMIFTFIPEGSDEKQLSQQFLTSSITRQFTLTNPGNYILHIVATDNDGQSCGKIYRNIIVTDSIP